MEEFKLVFYPLSHMVSALFIKGCYCISCGVLQCSAVGSISERQPFPCLRLVENTRCIVT